MPQLDTVYILLIYIWTWLVIYLISKKIKSFMITTTPKQQYMKPNKPTPMMPWT